MLGREERTKDEWKRSQRARKLRRLLEEEIFGGG